MKFLVDANLPPGLAAWLRDLGHEATHVRQAPGATVDDRTIFDYARASRAVIVSKDEDFTIMTSLQKHPAPVVWLRLGNATNAELRAWLAPLLPEIV